MNDPNEPHIDWIHLPPIARVESLWECLHDAELISCGSSVRSRKVSLEFRIAHLAKYIGCSLTFLVNVHDVRSVRANMQIGFPSDDAAITNAEPAERDRMLVEYHSKYREESMGWLHFEGSLETDPLAVYDAELARYGGAVALKIGGTLDGQRYCDSYCSVVIRGSEVTASRSDGEPFSLKQLTELGRAYWLSFGQTEMEHPG
jgi:hypothetical protein